MRLFQIIFLFSLSLSCVLGLNFTASIQAVNLRSGSISTGTLLHIENSTSVVHSMVIQWSYNSVTERIIQVYNRQGYQRAIHSQLILSQPWNLETGCCQHEYMEAPVIPRWSNISQLTGASFTMYHDDNIRVDIKNATVQGAVNMTEILSAWNSGNVACPLSCTSRADFVLLIDESGSITASSFQAMKEFIHQFASRFDIRDRNVGIGIVSFSGVTASTASDQFCLPDATISNITTLWEAAKQTQTWSNEIEWNTGLTSATGYKCMVATPNTNQGGYAAVELPILYDEVVLNEAISRLNQDRMADGIYFTGTGTGLRLSGELFKRKRDNMRENGAVKDIVITLTDGYPNRGEATSIAAQALRNEGITTFAVGVGSGVGMADLQQIAGNESNIYTVTNYFALVEAVEPLVESVCQGTRRTASQCRMLLIDPSSDGAVDPVPAYQPDVSERTATILNDTAKIQWARCNMWSQGSSADFWGGSWIELTPLSSGDRISVLADEPRGYSAFESWPLRYSRNRPQAASSDAISSWTMKYDFHGRHGNSGTVLSLHGIRASTLATSTVRVQFYDANGAAIAPEHIGIQRFEELDAALVEYDPLSGELRATSNLVAPGQIAPSVGLRCTGPYYISSVTVTITHMHGPEIDPLDICFGQIGYAASSDQCVCPNV